MPAHAPNCSRLILQQLLQLLQLGRDKQLLNAEQYGLWLKVINVEGNQAEVDALLKEALERFPKQSDFWALRLALDIQQGTKNKYKKTLEAARVSCAKEDLEKLWSSFMQLMNKAGRGEEAYMELEAVTEQGRDAIFFAFI